MRHYFFADDADAADADAMLIDYFSCRYADADV